MQRQHEKRLFFHNGNGVFTCRTVLLLLCHRRQFYVALMRTGDFTCRDEHPLFT